MLEGVERALRRLEFYYTPKRGSWLDITECKRSTLTRQCLSEHRIGGLKDLRTQTEAWSANIDGRQRGREWQMKIGNARCKLKSVYMKIIL